MLNNIKDYDPLHERLECLDKALNQMVTHYSLAISSCHTEGNTAEREQQLKRVNEKMNQLNQSISQLALLITKI